MIDHQNDGRTYYYNYNTNTTVWEKPYSKCFDFIKRCLTFDHQEGVGKNYGRWTADEALKHEIFDELREADEEKLKDSAIETTSNQSDCEEELFRIVVECDNCGGEGYYQTWKNNLAGCVRIVASIVPLAGWAYGCYLYRNKSFFCDI